MSFGWRGKMARRRKIKPPLETFAKGDLVKLVPLTPDHVNAHLIPPGTVGVVLGHADFDPLPEWQLLEVQFFIMQKPVMVYATWLAKVDYL